MASKEKPKSKLREGEIKPCDLTAASLLTDFPFGPILCRKEHESIFKQLFQSTRTKIDVMESAYEK